LTPVDLYFGEYPSAGDPDVTLVEKGREEQHYQQAMREVRGEV